MIIPQFWETFRRWKIRLSRSNYCSILIVPLQVASVPGVTIFCSQIIVAERRFHQRQFSRRLLGRRQSVAQKWQNNQQNVQPASSPHFVKLHFLLVCLVIRMHLKRKKQCYLERRSMSGFCNQFGILYLFSTKMLFWTSKISPCYCFHKEDFSLSLFLLAQGRIVNKRYVSHF